MSCFFTGTAIEVTPIKGARRSSDRRRQSRGPIHTPYPAADLLRRRARASLAAVSQLARRRVADGKPRRTFRTTRSRIHMSFSLGPRVRSSAFCVSLAGAGVVWGAATGRRPLIASRSFENEHVQVWKSVRHAEPARSPLPPARSWGVALIALSTDGQLQGSSTRDGKTLDTYQSESRQSDVARRRIRRGSSTPTSIRERSPSK